MNGVHCEPKGRLRLGVHIDVASLGSITRSTIVVIRRWEHRAMRRLEPQSETLLDISTATREEIIEAVSAVANRIHDPCNRND